ncbi:MAG: Inositol 2-dehydrogenase/D-chiro-inositol 3-dehydrogenase [Chloroflexi bacterium ADurb.Bin325]|nr:MAG: Inositol 2-dehydrogenase/D-chiro-inositol 3-dehydrogenase [Chloroflexi bacterium ADurb.Bin325]
MSNVLKLGMVGLDTSHCEAFARMLHDPTSAHYQPGAAIVALYPGGSDAFSLSRDRVKGFTATLQQITAAPLYDDLAALSRDVDAILLQSVDGRQHEEQFAQIAAGKPVFVDKPFAVTSAAARALIRRAQETGTPLMSSSSLRYAAGLTEALAESGPLAGCETFGPAALLDDYPGLFWYGIHAAEMLFTALGAGCRQVQCLARPGMDIVLGDWADGRVGVMRGVRAGKGEFGYVLHAADRVRCGVASAAADTAARLMAAIMTFFRTGQPPIDLAMTFEIVAFLEAAEISRARGGQPVALETL